MYTFVNAFMYRIVHVYTTNINKIRNSKIPKIPEFVPLFVLSDIM